MGSKIKKTVDKYCCCTLPMRNWHGLPKLFVFLFSVVHCLWGIDTFRNGSVLFDFHKVFLLYIAYEELTHYEFLHWPIFHNSCTLPMRNWHHISCFFYLHVYFVVHCLRGIDTHCRHRIRRHSCTLPKRNWHIVHCLNNRESFSLYIA